MDQIEGSQTLYYPNGLVKYEGLLQNNEPSGQGKLYKENGILQFVGEFENGIIYGQGIYYYPNGDRYEGTIINHKRNGYGKYYSGIWMFQANFINNRIGKVGQIYKNNILLYSGEIVNDKPHGLGTKYNTNNTIMYHGMFIDGKIQVEVEVEELEEPGELEQQVN
jgi:hypothetical protein